MSRHTYDTDIEIAGLSLTVEITFDFEPGYKGDEVDPAAEPSAEIVTVHAVPLKGTPEFPSWLVDHLNASLDLHDELVGYAIEQSQPDPDALYDAARDAANEAHS